MRLLLGLGFLVALATLATSRRVWSKRKMPLLAVLSAGGWFAFGLGLVLGPKGLVILRAQDIYTLNHIPFFCLGWVGLNIGLQARADIIRTLTREVVRDTLADIILSVLILTPVFFLVLNQFITFADPKVGAFLAAILSICSFGWLGEIRSMRMCGMGGRAKLRLYLGATSGLSSIISVLCFGLLLEFTAWGSLALDDWSRWGGAGVGIITALLVALLLGFLAKYLLRLAARQRSDYLVVLLGLVALPAAVAIVMGYSTLFLAMLTGTAVANIARRNSVRLQSVLLEGEMLIATALMLVAGLVADPLIGYVGVFLVLSALIARALVKWLAVYWPLQKELSRKSRLRKYIGGLRQSYLAPIFVLSLCGVMETPIAPMNYPFEKLLTVVALIGLLSHLLPTVSILSIKARKASIA